MDDVKTCWRYCPLIDFLRDQEKIKSFAECHRIVDYGSTRWIVWRPAFIGEETRVYSFTDNHERNARSIIASLHFIARLKASSLSRFDYFIRFSSDGFYNENYLDRSDFSFHNSCNISCSYTVTIDDDIFG